MGGPVGFGLRARIIAALVGAFFAALALLGFAALRLAHEVRLADRHASLEELALVLASSGAASDRSRVEEVERRLVEEGDIVEVLIVPSDTLRSTGRGSTQRGLLAVAPIDEEREIRVLGRLSAGPSRLGSWLGLYIGLTGVAMLLLAYLVLTRWIVNPIVTLIDASERLARGRLETRVPVGGVAELVRLANAFNAMASSLRDERSTLVDRVSELQHLTRKLESTQEQVVRGARLASVGRLAAGVAHEVGNPLAAITGLLELIRGGNLERAERDDFLRRAQEETERISSIIRELLDFARVQPDLEDEATCDLVQVVDDVIRLTLPLHKALPPVHVASATAQVIVRGSHQRLKQVVLNLLLNAFDAVGDTGEVRVEIDVDGNEGILRVLDDGPGIDPRIRDQLFEPFVTTKAAGQGTGLGLAVTHTLVERLGGAIDGRSQPERGAAFTVRLPRPASSSTE